MTKRTITLEGANAVGSESVVKAKELGLAEVVAVYDESGILKALASMDGARATSVNFALDKAYPSERRQAATQDLADTFAPVSARF